MLDPLLGYEVDFLPVGDGRSGDAIAVRFGYLHATPARQTVVVIDGGYSDSGNALVEHVRTHYRTNRVDLVISTHPDADHTSGLEAVLELCDVGALWMHQPWNHTDDIASMFSHHRVTDASVSEKLKRELDSARSLEQLAIRKRIPISEPFTGLADSTGHVVIAGPTPHYYESLLPDFRCTPEPKVESKTGLYGGLWKSATDIVTTIAEAWHIETLSDSGVTSAENNTSAITMMQFGNDLLMFTGDAGIPALEAALESLTSAGVDLSPLKFFQVPHHGSRRNISPAILDRIVGLRLPAGAAATRTAFISAGANCEPKHPAKKVMNALTRRGVGVHVTAGRSMCHYNNAPGWRARGWSALTPQPLFLFVEE